MKATAWKSIGRCEPRKACLMGESVAQEELTGVLSSMLTENAPYIDGGKTRVNGEPCWLKYYEEGKHARLQGGGYSL